MGCCCSSSNNEKTQDKVQEPTAAADGRSNGLDGTSSNNNNNEDMSPKADSWLERRKNMAFDEIEAKELPKALDKLAVSMYAKSEPIYRKEAALIFSPLSMAYSLALIESWSSEDARVRLQELIGPTVSAQISYAPQYKRLVDGWQSQGVVRVATGFFRDDHLKLAREKLEEDVWREFKAELMAVPFRDDVEKARVRMNDWIREKMDSNSIEKNRIRSGTQIFMVNLVRMKIKWEVPFDPRTNKIRPFYKFGGNDTQMVPFMERSGFDIPYARRPGYQIVELACAGWETSIYLIMSTCTLGIESVEKQLNAALLVDMFKSTSCESQRFVHVAMPKLGAVRLRIDAMPILDRLGVGRLDKLQRMFKDLRIAVTDAVHEVMLEMDEIDGCSGKKSPFGSGKMCSIKSNDKLPSLWKEPAYDETKHDTVRVVADRPFLLALVHKSTASVLLMAKINRIEENAAKG